MDLWGALWTLLKSIDHAKPYLEVVQSVLTSLGIVAGGWWLWRQREQMPRAGVTLDVRSVPLDNQRQLIHVETTLANLGKVLIRVGRSVTRLHQVRPLVSDPLVDTGKREVAWPVLGLHDIDYTSSLVRIEPGESQPFEDHFVVDSSVEVVQVYSYFSNTALGLGKAEIGWGRTALVQLSPDKGATAMQSESRPAVPENTAATGPQELRQMAPKPVAPPAKPPSGGPVPSPHPGGQMPFKPAPPPPPPSKKR